MTSTRDWVAGARPRTLPLAVAPVITACAGPVVRGHAAWVFAGGAAVVALLLQIGVNYANDYSDGIRGTDRDRARTGGPVRLVGQGLAAPAAVKGAALTCLALAAVVGLTVAAASGHWAVVGIGAAAIPAAWFYTGGSRPYGYAGLGELFVFVFFGLAAAAGTELVQTGSVTAATWLLGSGQGLLASAVLMVNNLRDIATDTEHGKRTLATRLGDRRARGAYLVMMLLAALLLAAGCAQIMSVPASLLVLLVAAVAGLLLARPVLRGATGRELVRVLAGTGRLALLLSLIVLALAVMTAW
ncbi:MAG: 1,4-dihydroxy-2-naphthoate polyprenyltransferase [Actinomycetales bacterium]|nr:1,4-dihydroxy-2-naphthoate polyprenyltransferase [Actinomycetales bacterium]